MFLLLNFLIFFLSPAAGVSRSTSLVLAYLMREEKLSFPVAATLVKSARLIVHPNPSFVEQLLRFEGANRKGCTIREFYLEPSQLREGHGGHVCSNNLVWRSGQVLGVEHDGKDPKWFSKYI